MTYRAESRIAYDAITPSIGELAQRVLDHVRSAGRHGCICDEVMRDLGLTHQTASPRFTELEAKGWIRRTGERRLTRSGNPAAIYVYTEPGTLFSSPKAGRADTYRAVVRAAIRARQTGDWLAFDSAWGTLPQAERKRITNGDTR